MVHYFSLFLWAKGCYTKNTHAEDFDLSTGTVYSTNLWPLNSTCGCEGTTINTDRNDSESLERTESANKQTPGHVSLSTLLEFAIGAAECLELMGNTPVGMVCGARGRYQDHGGPLKEGE